MKKTSVEITTEKHLKYAEEISVLIQEASKVKGTGIAKRSAEYIGSKMRDSKAVIAFYNNKPAGFCYIESWGHEKFVANSGLIVFSDARNMGLAKDIKAKAFELSAIKFPNAKLFGLTTSLAVMKINSGLGYKPVTFSELTDDFDFWKGCETCEYFDILSRTKRKQCLCTAMLYDKSLEVKKNKNGIRKPLKVYDRWNKLKQYVFLKK